MHITRADVIRIGLSLALTALLIAGPSPAWAQTIQPLVLPGTTGAIDEDSLSLYKFDGGALYVKPLAVPPNRTVQAFYLVAPLPALFTNVDGVKMTVRYLDNGDGARVEVRLIEQHLTTDAKDKRMTFNSDAYPASSSFQSRTIKNCKFGNFFDFLTRGYYLLVQLERTSNTGTPALMMVQLQSTTLLDCNT